MGSLRAVSIGDSEQQLAGVEKSVHLERETQEALDPSVGQVESTAMQKEIHRMELRYDQLKRRQDFPRKSADGGISKWEGIF